MKRICETKQTLVVILEKDRWDACCLGNSCSIRLSYGVEYSEECPITLLRSSLTLSGLYFRSDPVNVRLQTTQFEDIASTGGSEGQLYL